MSFTEGHPTVKARSDLLGICWDQRQLQSVAVKIEKFPMDHRAFQFATRGQCLKGNRSNVALCDSHCNLRLEWMRLWTESSSGIFPDTFMKEMAANRAWLKKQSKLKADEKKRRGSQKNYADIFGMEGSFRQLNIDWYENKFYVQRNDFEMMYETGPVPIRKT